MVELFTAKSGAPSLKVDGIALHSPYDPVREARRFVQESLGRETPSVVVILGECVGHLSQAVAEAHPRALVLPVVYSPEITVAAGLPRRDVWDPSGPGALEEYLRARVGELQVEGLRVLEWPPSARAFPTASRAANEAVRRVVQELNGSFVTTVAAGRLWLRNCLSNFLYLDEVLAGPRSAPGRPIVVAAPGPSLELAAAAIEGARGRIALWALPSSCPFLLDRGLQPDLVVMTDPGYYALHHLHFAAPACPVVMPLSAARGCWALSPRPAAIFLEQPFLVERSLLSAAGVKAPWVAPHGTVTATAVELALSCTDGPVILAGLDLGSRDLLTHARPNAFDALLHRESSRLLPHLGQWFARDADLGSFTVPGSAGFRSTTALRTYAGWLEDGLQATRGRLYRLLPSPQALSSMQPLDERDLQDLLSPFPAGGGTPAGDRLRGYPDAARRREIAGRLIREWRDAVRAAHRGLGGGLGGGLAGDSQEGQDLGAQPLVLDLAHMISPRHVVDALRRSRRGQAAAARDSAAQALAESEQVLRDLAEKLGA